MSLAGWGALAGIGRGISDVSRQNELDRLQQERLDAAAARNSENADLRRELLAERLAAKGVGAAAAGKPGAMSVVDIANNPELLTAASGGQLSREDAEAFIDLNRNGNPKVDAGVVLDDNEGEQRVQAPKYEPGRAAAIAKRGLAALYSAMKLGNPAAADDLARSQLTDTQRQAVEDYQGSGSERAGSSALLAAGKPVNSDGTNVVSGNVTPGSLDAARIKTEGAKQAAEGALAGKRNAEASSERGGGKGGAPKVKSSYVDASGDRIQQLTDGTKVNLGKDKSYQSMLAREVADIRKSMDGVGKSADEIEEMAAGRIARRAASSQAAPGGDKKPDAATIKALPAGAKLIGTSKGKPVYQTPDGKRFIQD